MTGLRNSPMSRFIAAELEVPRHLDRKVHDLYFNLTVEEFEARTMWIRSNAFTSAFKELEPIPQFNLIPAVQILRIVPSR